MKGYGSAFLAVVITVAIAYAILNTPDPEARRQMSIAGLVVIGSMWLWAMTRTRQAYSVLMDELNAEPVKVEQVSDVGEADAPRSPDLLTGCMAVFFLIAALVAGAKILG